MTPPEPRTAEGRALLEWALGIISRHLSASAKPDWRERIILREATERILAIEAEAEHLRSRWHHSDVDPFDPHFCEDCDELKRQAASPDSEALRAALERIMEAHHRDPDGGMGYTGNEYGTIKDACVVCGTSDEYAVPWPCWTYEQARAALTPEAEDDATNA
jgi:hypothetical protein